MCPRTGGSLNFGNGDSVVRVDGRDVTYPIVDGIVDFCPDVKDMISEDRVSNVHLFRADVANLPVRDGAVEILLSLAGLHAFADKQLAIKEMRRVLREQGTLLALTYVGGVRRRADWIVKHLLARRGFFSLPLLHIDDVASLLEGFTIRQQDNFESCAWFEAVKNDLAESRVL